MGLQMLSFLGPHLFSESPFCPEVWITDTLSIRFYANFGDYVPPTFHTLRNLTHLRLLSGIDAEGFDLNLLSCLTCFLECSPNIKVLVLQGCSLTKSWSPPLRVPRCLLFHLKEVEFLEFGRAKHEFEVIEYLLKSAEVMNKMTIHYQHSDTLRIAQFPRALKTCVASLIFQLNQADSVLLALQFQLSPVELVLLGGQSADPFLLYVTI